MDGTTPDETSHGNDEGHHHQQNRPPVQRHPLTDRVQRLFVKQKSLQPRQRAFRVNVSAFLEDITVSVEVVTGGTGSSLDSRDMLHDLNIKRASTGFRFFLKQKQLTR